MAGHYRKKIHIISLNRSNNFNETGDTRLFLKLEKQRFREITELVHGSLANRRQTSIVYSNLTLNMLHRINYKESQINLALTLSPCRSEQVCCNLFLFLPWMKL